MHPNVATTISALQAVYRTNAAGCCWHILADDGNVEQGHVIFCEEYAREHGHPACIAVIEPMSKLSRTQREKMVAKHYDKYAYPAEASA
jgi:hypothetical protein